MERELRDLVWLQFKEKRSKNPNYFLRAFARDVGISVTAISEFFSRKRDLSIKNKTKVIEALALNPNLN